MNTPLQFPSGNDYLLQEITSPSQEGAKFYWTVCAQQEAWRTAAVLWILLDEDKLSGPTGQSRLY